jgi:hypothetical protein
MATTTRSKYKQMLKEMEERENLTQEIIEESESDPNYEDETDILSEKSYATIQEISENVISDISGIIIIDDDVETDKQTSKKVRKPPTKITKPKTSWVWKILNLMKIILKLFAKLVVVKKCLNGVDLQVLYQYI